MNPIVTNGQSLSKGKGTLTNRVAANKLRLRRSKQTKGIQPLKGVLTRNK